MTQARVRAGAPLDAAEDRANKKPVADVVRRIEDFQNQFLGGTFGMTRKILQESLDMLTPELLISVVAAGSVPSMEKLRIRLAT